MADLQNAREKQACKIRQSLNYTQHACIYHREISSPLLLHTSCVYFLKADLKEVVKCWSIIVSSHSNFSINCMYWSVCLKVDYSKQIIDFVVHNMFCIILFLFDIVLSRRCSNSRVGSNEFGLERSWPLNLIILINRS